jgi:hypothetical protein
MTQYDTFTKAVVASRNCNLTIGCGTQLQSRVSSIYILKIDLSVWKLYKIIRVETFLC